MNFTFHCDVSCVSTVIDPSLRILLLVLLPMVLPGKAESEKILQSILTTLPWFPNGLPEINKSSSKAAFL